MYVRATTRKNKDGSAVRYLQLAHNEWDADTGTSRPQVLHSFGREDQLDRAAVERLVASLTRLLDPAAALRATSGSELTFLALRPMGGAHALDGLWHRIGIDVVMKKAGSRGSNPGVGCSRWYSGCCRTCRASKAAVGGRRTRRRPLSARERFQKRGFTGAVRRS
jgi:precorrin-6x reductase